MTSLKDCLQKKKKKGCGLKMTGEVLYKLTIPIEPKTKKNKGRIAKRGGRTYILPSKDFEEYQNACRWFVKTPDEPITQKCNIKATYYRKTRRRVDITNLHSALHDVLTHYGVIADDDCKIVVGTDGSRVKVDGYYPRTVVEITAVDEVTGFE
jgi:Holliday junction resolvase RusA-like endonuclease